MRIEWIDAAEEFKPLNVPDGGAAGNFDARLKQAIKFCLTQKNWERTHKPFIAWLETSGPPTLKEVCAVLKMMVQIVSSCSTQHDMFWSILRWVVRHRIQENYAVQVVVFRVE